MDKRSQKNIGIILTGIGFMAIGIILAMILKDGLNFPILDSAHIRS